MSEIYHWFITSGQSPLSCHRCWYISEHAQEHAPHSSKMQRIFECAQKSKEVSDISAGSVLDIFPMFLPASFPYIFSAPCQACLCLPQAHQAAALQSGYLCFQGAV